MDRIINTTADEGIIFITSSKQSDGEKTLMEPETFTFLEGELSVQVGK